MKKSSLILCFFSALLVFACVPTPEEEFILKKDTQQMIDSAESAMSESLEKMAKVPENMHISEEVESTRTDVRITIDADVVLPDTAAIPVVHIGHGMISEEVLCNIKHLIGKDSGELDGFPRAYYLTEAQKWADRRDTGDLDKYSSVEELNAVIAELMARANVSPEKPVFKEQDPLNEMKKKGAVSYYGWSDQETILEFHLSPMGLIYFLRDIQKDSEFNNYRVGTNPINRLQAEIDNGKIVIHLPERSMDDATAFAEKLVHDLGLTDFTCVGTRIAPMIPNGIVTNEMRDCECVYEVLFTRQINGVNITYTDVRFADGAIDSDSYAPIWHYEKIQVFVDDAGVFGFLFNEQYEILDTTIPSVKLISLEDAIKSFVQMMEFKFANSEGLQIKKNATIQVTEIRLGLTRVQEKGSFDQAYLVPSWTFFGVYDLDARGTQGYDGTDPLLTVNALDGTVIDPAIGY